MRNFPGERHSEAGIMRLIKKIFKTSGRSDK